MTAASLVAQTVKNLPAVQETQFQSLGQEDPLEKVIATNSSILASKIPWTEEPGRLQSMGSQRVTQQSNYGPIHSLPRMKFRCDSNSCKYGEKQVTSNLCVALGASLVAQTVNNTCNVGDLRSVPRLGRCGEGHGNPLQYSFLESPTNRRLQRVRHD